MAKTLEKTAVKTGGLPQPLKKMTVSTRKAHIFALCVLAYMLVQWAIVWIYGNINNILLAFQYFDPETEQQVFYTGSALFTNFKDFFVRLFSDSRIGGYFWTGVIYHLVGLVCLPLSLMFAFVIYKKMPGAGLFKVVLFLPSVISGMVIAMLFKMMTVEAFREIFVKWFGGTYAEFNAPLTSNTAALPTLILYQFFFGLPGSLLINIGSMTRTPKELVEYGRLEGLSYFQEFIHLTLPLMFPILQIYCLGLFTGFFTAQGPLYAIYSDGSSGMYLPENAKSFGYYMMVSVISNNANNAPAEYMYGFTTAANLSIGLISIPIIYGTKKLFDRFDPEATF